MDSSAPETSETPPGDRAFLGHPRGLSTLFFTEMWERFSFYGMRALLVLYMTALVEKDGVALENPGLGMDKMTAGAIYGLYTFGVYALALPGGWIADRLLGQRRAVLYGGTVIALGHYILAIPVTWSFYPGLVLVALGTGLLKPNISAIVAGLYVDTGPRRDAGFYIFYMGINLGALLGPMVCSGLGEGAGANWHLGFGAAGVGMTLALIQYVRGARHLGRAGLLEASGRERSEALQKFFLGLGVVVGLTALFFGLSSTGAISLPLVYVAEKTGMITLAVVLLYFAHVIIFQCRDGVERKRVGLIAVLFLGAAIFWSGLEQAGSSMTLFARDNTDRLILGWELKAGWFQSVPPLFVVLLAPVMGTLWVWLGSRNPAIGIKFALGLLLLGVGFLVVAWGSTFATTEEGIKLSPMWLVVTYFLHTVGELCLSPTGLSSVTKLSPKRLLSQMMGTWFMGAAVGNLIAGLVAGHLDTLSTDRVFGTVAAVAMGTGILFAAMNWLFRKLAHGVQ